MIFLNLFWSFFQIGLFSFGGGYASLPLLKQQMVDAHGWLTMTEFTDLLTLSQMTPGPIALNAATFAGVRVAGVAGAVACTVGFAAPSLLIVSALAWMYRKYKTLSLAQGVLTVLRPASVGLIFSAGLSIVVLAFWGSGGFTWRFEDLRLFSVSLFAVCFFALRRFRVNPLWVILGGGLAGALVYFAGA